MPAGTARAAPRWQPALHHLSSHLPEEALPTRRVHLSKKTYAVFKRNQKGKAKGTTLFLGKDNKKACVSLHYIPSGWSSPQREFCAQRVRSPGFPKEGGGWKGRRKGGRSGHYTSILPFLDIGVRTPQRGGHWRVSLTQVSAASSTRGSALQTPRPRGARACGPRSGPRSGPSRTPGLSFLSGGTHLHPVPADPAPRPGPRGPLSRGAFGPVAATTGPQARQGLGGRSHTVTGLSRDRGVRGALPADAAGSPSAGSDPTWTPYG